MPAIRSADQPRARSHGELIGLDLYSGRDITIDLVLMANDGVTLMEAQSELGASLETTLTTEEPLWFQIPNLEVLCAMCRPRKRTMTWDFNYAAAGLGLPTVQFHATDPRLYGAGQSVEVGLANPTSALIFPVTFPATFGSVSPNGVTVTNAGNTPMSPAFVITGPVTNPVVINATIDGSPQITISNPNQSGVTVYSGDQIVVDTDFHSILYYTGGVSSGTTPADVSSWIVAGSTWFDLLAGDNLIQFLSQDFTARSAILEIQWADAYLI